MNLFETVKIGKRFRKNIVVKYLEKEVVVIDKKHEQGDCES